MFRAGRVMVLHAEADYKGKPGRGKVPLCRQWSMSNDNFGPTTPDNAKVSCTRCAKALGITPAAKPDPVNPTGTCQCCFAGFKVPKTTVTLHGYKRPGVGYILGRCRGEGHLPYEVSCDQTKVFLAEVQGMIARETEFLTDLASGAITEMRVATHGPKYLGRGQGLGGHEVVYVTLHPGDKAKDNPAFKGDPSNFWNAKADGAYGIPSWEKAVARAKAEAEGRLSHMKSDASFLTGKIKGWKPQPWPPKSGKGN